MVTLYTHFTDSHKPMYDRFFYPSLRKLYSKDEVKVRALHTPQISKTGSFMSQGFVETVDVKVDHILRALDEQEQFIFADVDICFYKPFVDDIMNKLKNYDIVCQEDRDSLCSGFFACKSNSLTKGLFKEIKNHLRANNVNDQVSLNALKGIVTSGMLDKRAYYTVGNFFTNKNGTNIWDNRTDIKPTKEMILHHANYVVGVDNKIKLLEMIQNNYERKNFS